MRPRSLCRLLVGGLLAGLAGCAQAAPADAAAPVQALTVLAASSLTDVFTDLEPAFEAAHPGVDVTISFAGSQALATQVRHGIAADVYASADARHVEALLGEDLVERPRRFAENTLVLVISHGAPAVDLEHLPQVGSLVVGSDTVPVGRYTAALLDAAGGRYGEAWREQVAARVVSREPNVRLVLAKVAMGEVDAAFVYATDVAAARGVRAVDLPPDLAPPTSYHHAQVVGAPAPGLAGAWMRFVQGPEGRAALARHGFRVEADPS